MKLRPRSSRFIINGVESWKAMEMSDTEKRPLILKYLPTPNYLIPGSSYRRRPRRLSQFRSIKKKKKKDKRCDRTQPRPLLDFLLLPVSAWELACAKVQLSSSRKGNKKRKRKKKTHFLCIICAVAWVGKKKKKNPIIQRPIGSR